MDPVLFFVTVSAVLEFAGQMALHHRFHARAQEANKVSRETVWPNKRDLAYEESVRMPKYDACY